MTAAEMIQSYAEVRARLMGKTSPVIIKRALLSPPALPPPEPTFKPAYKQRDFIDLMNIQPPKALEWKVILKEVALQYGTTVEKMISRGRGNPAAHARQEAMWRMRMESRMSFPAIGYRFGGRDHSTVIAGVNAHEARRNAS